VAFDIADTLLPTAAAAYLLLLLPNYNDQSRDWIKAESTKYGISWHGVVNCPYSFQTNMNKWHRAIVRS